MAATAKVALRNLAATLTAIKSSEGQLCGLQVLNNQAAAAYVQLFDAATGSVTLGTTAPAMEVLAPATSQVNVPLPDGGVWFDVAISAASTTTEAGATGSAAGVMVFAQIA